MVSPTVSGRIPLGPAPSAKRRGVLLPVVGLVVLALLTVMTIGVLQRAIGTGGVVIGTLVALLPVVPVVAAFLWVDRWEPEPPRMLMGAFLWGAGFAALVSLLINTSASAVLDAAAGRGAGDLFGPIVVAPIVEEFAKGLFIVGLLVFRRREFDGIVDGIVYAGIIAAGFAFSENILYLGRAVSDPETAGVLSTLFVRGIASPFAHPLFTCMIGIAAGLSVASRSIGARVLALLGGYLAAVVLHALWNGASVLAASPGVFYEIYAFVMVPLFAGMFTLVVYARRREARIVAAQLPGFAAAGWIAPSEVPLLARLSRRRGWQALVRRRSGKAAAKAVAEYQAAVTELAFMRNRIARGAVQDSASELHDEKLAAVLRTRAIAVGVPEALVAAWARQRPSGWQPPPPAAPDGSFSGAFKIPDLGAEASPGTGGPAPGRPAGSVGPGPGPGRGPGSPSGAPHGPGAGRGSDPGARGPDAGFPPGGPGPGPSGSGGAIPPGGAGTPTPTPLRGAGPAQSHSGPGHAQPQGGAGAGRPGSAGAGQPGGAGAGQPGGAGAPGGAATGLPADGRPVQPAGGDRAGGPVPRADQGRPGPPGRDAAGRPVPPDPYGPTRPVRRPAEPPAAPGSPADPTGASGTPAPASGDPGPASGDPGADPSGHGRHHDDPANPGLTRPMRRPDEPEPDRSRPAD
ncbi:PrsW family intramembrane metalloprotease [Pseudonocardia sp. HH130630-07]|uniref:PrsW family intramembrane metalloprotease n=1 Tax=Pseudonocardia sp. HH130630-07 TaxID=1690815 RepID=UPI000839BFEE|nr:PrsW family intramembrane metalloprotease [Pseudonocardia sp. HH130630-07]